MAKKAPDQAPAPEKRERAVANANNDMVNALKQAIPNAKFAVVNLDEIWVNKANNIRDIASKSYTDDEIADMEQQIEAAGGIMQSILLAQLTAKPETENKPYALCIGFRRILAAKNLAERNPKYKENIPALIVPAIQSRTAMKILQLIENVARVDLTPVEEANTIQEIVADTTSNLQYKDVAALLGKSPQNVSQLVKILKFPKEIQDMIHAGDLSFSHAREIQQYAPEADWTECAKTGATMTHGLFKKHLMETYDTAEATTGDATAAADGSQQKTTKMVKSTEIKNCFIPWLTKRLEAANGTDKKYTAKDLESARLEVFKTVMLEETGLVKEIQPFMEEQKKAEEQAAKEKDANDKKEDFFRKSIKAVDEILKAPVDVDKPDAKRASPSEAWASVAQKVYAMKDEEKKTLGFDLPKEAKDFVTLLGTKYTEHAKEVRENAKKRAEAKAKKDAEDKQKADSEKASGGTPAAAAAPVAAAV